MCVQWFSAGMLRRESLSAARTSRQSVLAEGRSPRCRMARVSSSQAGVVQNRRQSAASSVFTFRWPGGSSLAGAGSPVNVQSFQSFAPGRLPNSTTVAAG